jgi:hypothetical protein
MAIGRSSDRATSSETEGIEVKLERFHSFLDLLG